MDNERHGIRASGVYATYDGHDYLAHRLRDHVRILSDEDPLPPVFGVSKKSWVRGEAVVDIGSIQRLVRVQTTCGWRGHRFEVGVIVGDQAYVTYLGKDFDEVTRLPGMERPDKFEVVGELPVSELADVDEQVEELPLGDSPTDERRRHDLT